MNFHCVEIIKKIISIKKEAMYFMLVFNSSLSFIFLYWLSTDMQSLVTNLTDQLWSGSKSWGAFHSTNFNKRRQFLRHVRKFLAGNFHSIWASSRNFLFLLSGSLYSDFQWISGFYENFPRSLIPLHWSACGNFRNFWLNGKCLWGVIGGLTKADYALSTLYIIMRV